MEIKCRQNGGGNQKSGVFMRGSGEFGDKQNSETQSKVERSRWRFESNRR